MEHPCPHCGAKVDDSSPFCSSCGSPQIRVAGSAPLLPSVRVPDHLEAVLDSRHALNDVEPSPPTAVRLHHGIGLRAAFGAGLVGAVISLLLGPIAGAPAGGFLSVVFYRRRSWPAELATSAGFRLGSLAGAFGSAIFLLVYTGQGLLTHNNEMREKMIEYVRSQLARNPDAESRHMLNYFLTPHGLILGMTLAAIFMAVIFILLSGLGGMISARLLRRKQ